MNREYDYDKVIDLVKSHQTKNMMTNAENGLNKMS